MKDHVFYTDPTARRVVQLRWILDTNSCQPHNRHKYERELAELQVKGKSDIRELLALIETATRRVAELIEVGQ